MLFDTKKISTVKILVAGDVMLDRYLIGAVKKISPEAPVPILECIKSIEMPGGAGNVAMNVNGMNCTSTLIGLRGDDEQGKKLEKLLDHNSINHKLIIDSARKTITKMRVIAQGQQLMRIDEELLIPLSEEAENEILHIFKKEALGQGAVILSDYAKGLFLKRKIVQAFISFCNNQDIPVLVDPKGKDWSCYEGAFCITPNAIELELVAGKNIGDEQERLITEAQKIREKYNINWILVTRGSKGMCLIGSGSNVHHIPSKAKEVYDVSGAGDTVIAVLATTVAMGIRLIDAVSIANIAAGIVVGKLGTSPIRYSELQKAINIQNFESKIE